MSASSPARSTSCSPRRPDGRAPRPSARPSARRRASSLPPRATCRGCPPAWGTRWAAGREREAPRERPAGWLSGSCLLVDLAAFASVGGFDPGYFMYFEDVDLAERLAERGRVHGSVPSALVRAPGRG